MKSIFLYQGIPPHYVHEGWADTIGAKKIYYNKLRLPGGVFLPIQGLLNSLVIPKSDIILCEGGSCLPIAASKKSFHKGIKIILIGADPLFYDINRSFGFKRKYLMHLASGVDGIIAVSKYWKNLAERYVNCPIKVVYPFTNIALFQKTKARLNTHNLCYIGRLDEYKGIRILLEAFEIIKNQVPDSSLTICGRGKLECHVLKHDVNYVGHVKHPETYLKECSFLVHPAKFDPFPCTVVEAMAAGVIPIVSRNTGSKEILPEYLVVDINPKSVADKIIELFNKPVKELKEIQKSLIKKSLEFDKEAKVREFKKQFLDLIKEIKK